MPPLTNNRLSLLWYYLRQHWLWYTCGVVFVIGTNWMTATLPKYIRLSIDLLTQWSTDNQQLLFRYVLTMFLLACGIGIVRTLSRILFFNPGRAIEHQLKNDIFTHLTRLQKNYYDQNLTGNIISRLNNDISGVRMICGFGMLQVFNILSSLSLTPWMMWQLSPQLTLYCILPIITIFTLVRIGMHFVIKHVRKHMETLL